MQKKGLILKKAIDPTVTPKTNSIDHARPSAEKGESSKSKYVPTGSNETKHNKRRKKPPAAAAPTRNMDSDFGSDYESEHETGRDKSLEEAQNRATFGRSDASLMNSSLLKKERKKRRRKENIKNLLKSMQALVRKRSHAPTQMHFPLLLSLIPMAHQFSPNRLWQ